MFFIVSTIAVCLMLQGTLQAQWIQSNGPSGGSIPCLLSDSVGYIYAGSKAGLYGSDDSGHTWTQLSPTMTDFAVMEIARGNGGSLYAASGAFKRGVYRSGDGGGTWDWTDVDPGLLYGYVYAMTLEPGTGDMLTGLYQNGVYRSSDNGGSWIQSGLIGKTVHCLAVRDSTMVFAGTSGGLFASTDHGVTWDAVVQATGNIRTLYVTTEGIILAGASSKNVFISTDQGVSWDTTIVDSLNYILAFASDTEKRLFAASGGGGVFRSNDSGTTWTRVNSGLTDLNVSSLLCVNGNVLAGTESRGVFSSSDHGDTWVHTDSGIVSTSVQALLSKDDGLLLAGTISQGIFRSTDQGGFWTPGISDSAIPSVYAFARHPGGVLFAGTNLWLRKSTDDGFHWNVSPTYPINFASSRVQSVIVDTGGMVYVAADRVYRSSNIGGTWSEVSGGINPATTVSCLSVNLHNKIYAGTSDGSIWGNVADGVYRLADNGAFWIHSNYGLPVENILSLLAFGDSTVLAGLEGRGIYRSTNGGNTWISADLQDSALYVFSIIRATSGDIYAATQHGVYHSIDDGLTWLPFTEGLLSSNVRALAEGPDHHLVAGTYYGGVFRTAAPVTGVGEVGNDVPDRYRLGQNYPNPFNPSTTIRFTVPRHDFVSLRVFNILGQEVAVLANEYREAGYHTVTWEAASMPSGVYLYTITARSFSQTRKMLLIR